MRKNTIKELISKSNIKFDNKFKFDKFVYIHQYHKGIIWCPKHGDFEMIPKSHLLSKYGCKLCGIEQNAINRRLTHSEFLEIAPKLHNNHYGYELVKFTETDDRIDIICPEHGIFNMTVSAHIHININAQGGYGRGCPRHGIDKRNLAHTLTKEEFLEQCKIHGNKYGYQYVVFINCRTKVKIFCNKHEIIFEQTPDSHISKLARCPLCAKESSADKRRFTQKEILESVRLIHPHYDYSEFVYTGIDNKAIIICPKPGHGKFLLTPYCHIHKEAGCPICQESRGERKIRNFLLNNSIEFDRQKRFDDCRNLSGNIKLPFDFYIPKINFIIEYDGEGHYMAVNFNGITDTEAKDGFERTVKNDEIKNKYCKENKIKILRIPYMEFKNIEKILKRKLKSILKNK